MGPNLGVTIGNALDVVGSRLRRSTGAMLGASKQAAQRKYARLVAAAKHLSRSCRIERCGPGTHPVDR
jgi:hypothetical protein